LGSFFKKSYLGFFYFNNFCYISTIINNLKNNNMGAIKEFYHEEICKMQQEVLNGSDFFPEVEEEDQIIISRASEIEEDLNNAELPRWMHPDVSVNK